MGSLLTTSPYKIKVFYDFLFKGYMKIKQKTGNIIYRRKGVGVAFWYLSITAQNNSRAVLENLRIGLSIHPSSHDRTSQTQHFYITPPGGESILEQLTFFF
jgi:hypothetical protein